MDLIDLTKLVPVEPPATSAVTRLRQRLNARRREEYEATCRTITLPPMPEVAKRDEAWIAKRRPKRRSQFRGVTWRRDIERWEAWYDHHGGKTIIGHYTDEIDAARARDDAMDRAGSGGRRNLPPLKGSTP
jgi:hypothetical protein